jgi:hypothetical protein
MKKLICLLAVLAALMGVLVVDLGRDPSPQDDGSVELAKRVETSSQPGTAARPSSSSAAELQRVIRQGAE